MYTRSRSRPLRHTLMLLIGIALTVIPLAGLLGRSQASAHDRSVMTHAGHRPVKQLPDEPLFGVLQAQPQYLHSTRAAGVTLRTVGVAWSQFEPREGVVNADYVARKREEFNAIRAAGYEVVLDLGLQYPPQWIWNYPHSRFVNQWGDHYTTTQIGANGVNAVFNAAVRQRQAWYVRQVFAAFGTDFGAVRLGWGYYGELNYPHPTYNTRRNSYWAFDALAQGQAPGLPAGMRPSPVPGWTPGTPSANHYAAAQFAHWYMDSLQNYHDWQIDVVRASYDGRLLMLYPSWGIRPNQLEGAVERDLDGSTAVERNGETQRGFNFAQFIAGIDDPLVVVYTTWLDADSSADHAADQRYWSPVHYLASRAQAHPLRLAVWGENTGRGSREMMQRSFDQATRYRLGALVWGFEGDLYSNRYASIDDYATMISAAR